MARPTLIVVSGPPGSGKTTLAHAIAKAVPCPAICRDEIKEGLVHADGSHEPSIGGPTSLRAYEVFFGVMRYLLDSGASLVVEAAFKHRLWAPRLEAIDANIRIVHCVVDPRIARDRIVRRATEDPLRQISHADRDFIAGLDDGTISFETYDRLTLDVPTIEVDTSSADYRPPLEEIVAFVARS